jgi:nucleoid DNA-binding protein
MVKKTNAVAKNVTVSKKTAKATKVKTSVKKTKRAPREVVPVKPIKEEMTKSELMNFLSEESGIEAKDVKKVMTKLEEAILGSLAPKGVGNFTLPGLVKFITRKVPARKAGQLVRNPATGEMVKGKAKPASVRVKARPLTKIKKAAIPAV